MDRKVNLPAIILHRAMSLLFSVRGLIAILFSVYMAMAGAYFLDAFMDSGTVIGELITVFNANPEFKFQWAFFDSALSKLVTLFVAPLFIFDAVSGDKSLERIGLVLSRPITRVQYMLINLSSAVLAFGIVFFGTIGPAYFLIKSTVPELTPGTFFATTVLMFLLGVVTMSVVLLISTLSRSNLISFIAVFGIMSFFMLPNASKYSSDAFMTLAKVTPHYYATYFTTHTLDAGLYIAFAAVIILYSLPFLALAVFKLKRDDL